MRQRVMIAMALANDPKLLIADEPTTALDVTVQAQILDLMERLQRELGMAIVIITHDLGVVAEMANDIAVMYAGRIVETAPATEMFASARAPLHVGACCDSIPRLERDREEPLVPIPGTPPSLISPPSGCRFHPRCAYAQPSHSRIDPGLEPLIEAPEHFVACLLEPQLRRALWGSLATGATPGEAKQSAGFVEEAPRGHPGTVSAPSAEPPTGHVPEQVPSAATGAVGDAASVAPAGGEPLVQTKNLVKHFPITRGILIAAQGRCRAGRRRRGPRSAPRGDARHRGRDRLRQEHHRAADHAPARRPPRASCSSTARTSPPSRAGA